MITDMCLSTRDDKAFKAIAISGAHTDVETGVLSQRFRKTICRAGDIYKQSEDHTFCVRMSHLENWALQFSRMKADGIAVRIPTMHGRADDPDATRGMVDDMYVVDDTLVMSCTMFGQDGIDAAMRNDVSIFAIKEYISDKKISYFNPIRHVAVCPDPTVSGLGAFIRIAASSAKETNMIWKEFETKFGVTEVTDANAFDKLGGVHSKVVEECNKLKAVETTLSEASTKLADANKELTSKLSAATKGCEPPHAQVVKLSMKMLDKDLDGLVDDGNVTPAVRKTLGEIFDEKAVTLALSEDPQLTTLNRIIAALAENAVIALGEHAGAQVVGLTSELSEQANGKDAHDILATGMEVIAKEAKANNENVASTA